MNSFTTLLLVLFGLASADCNYSPYADEDLSDVMEDEIEDDQIWRVPQFDGTFKLMTEQEAKELTIQSEISQRIRNIHFFANKRQKVRFFLHTRMNVMKWQEIDMDRPETLHRSNFNSSHPTR